MARPLCAATTFLRADVLEYNPRVPITIVTRGPYRKRGSTRAYLTTREREVVSAILTSPAGRKQIAFDLGISIKTMKQHLSNARRHIGAPNFTGMVLAAIRQGLIEVPGIGPRDDPPA